MIRHFLGGLLLAFLLSTSAHAQGWQVTHSAWEQLAGNGTDVHHWIQLQAPTLGSSWTLTLPTSAGTIGQVLQTDGTGITSWLTLTPSGNSWPFRAKTTTTSGYPGDSYILWNNATQTSATAILIAHIDGDNNDIDLFLSYFASGNKLVIQEDGNSANYQKWDVTGSATNFNGGTSTSYWSVPVTLNTSGGTGTTGFSNNEQLIVARFSSGGGGGGTVTSVGLALPASTFSISGSPVTTSGTLTGAFVTQSANTFFAGPTSGGAATPAWRSIVSGDLPDLGSLYIKNQYTAQTSAGFNVTAGAPVKTVDFTEATILNDATGSTDGTTKSGLSVSSTGSWVSLGSTVIGEKIIVSGGGAAVSSQGLAFNVTGSGAKYDLMGTSANWNITAAGDATLNSAVLAVPLDVANGGTGLTSATLGDVPYSSATNTLAMLAGNTTTTKNFLTQTGTGSVSAAPVWGTIASGDLPDLGSLYIKNQYTSQTSAGFDITGNGGANEAAIATTYAAGDATALQITNNHANAGNSNYGIQFNVSGAATNNYDLLGSANWYVSNTGVAAFGPQSISTAQTSGVIVANTTAAANAAQQYSPMILQSGQGWKTNATAGSQAVDFATQVVPTQGAANPGGYWTLLNRINGGSWNTIVSIANGASLHIADATATSGGFICGDNSNIITDVWFGGGHTASGTDGNSWTLHSEDGNGTNKFGGNLIVQAGLGAGSKVGGAIQFKSSHAGASGTSLGSPLAMMTLTPSGAAGSTALTTMELGASTASSGVIQFDNRTSSHTITLAAADPAASETVTLPDPGVAANVLYDNGTKPGIYVVKGTPFSGTQPPTTVGALLTLPGTGSNHFIIIGATCYLTAVSGWISNGVYSVGSQITPPENDLLPNFTMTANTTTAFILPPINSPQAIFAGGTVLNYEVQTSAAATSMNVEIDVYLYQIN